MLDVLSDDSENFFFFGEEGDNFICLVAAASTFRQGNQQSVSTFFPPDVAQAEARWIPESCKEKKTQVPTTKLNSFSPAGLQLCSKTSANTTDEQRHTLERQTFWKSAAIFQILTIWRGCLYIYHLPYPPDSRLYSLHGYNFRFHHMTGEN